MQISDSTPSSPISWSESSSQNTSPNSSPVKTPGLSDSLKQIGLGGARRLRLSFDEETDPRSLLPRPELSDLERTSEKISRLESPPLLAKEGDNANDVCFITSPCKSVFKPGKDNAQRAILCSRVARILDLADCVPETIEAKAARVISQEDLKNAQPVLYHEVLVDDKPWLVTPESCFELYIKNDRKKTVSFKGGCDFSIEQQEGEDFYKLVPKTKNAESHELANQEVLFAIKDYKEHVILFEGAIPITQDDTSPHVLRDEVRFELHSSQGLAGGSTSSSSDSDETDPDLVVLVREDVPGLLQPMVQNVVTEIDGVAIDLLNLTQEKEAAAQKFFSLISTASFTNAVCLATLFRLQDGKAHFLRESNFLFSTVLDKLHLTLIDLDETWPVCNELSQIPELQEKGDIAALRLGLMGYPQAHMPLDGDDKAHALSIFEKIKARSGQMLEALSQEKFADNDKITSAFNEVLESIAEFHAAKTERSFTLADFVFHVFPVYKQQWDALEKLGLGREEIAATIGYATVAEKTQEVAAKLARMQNNKQRLNK